tara:strand:+ start:206 stop:529 length:324 start_codon:yes stop_codon:yes gene_type:complete
MNPHPLSSYLQPVFTHTTKKGLEFSLDCIPKQYRKQVEEIAKQRLRNPKEDEMTYSYEPKYGEICIFQNKIFSVETKCQVGFRIRRTGIIANSTTASPKGSIFGMFD